MVLWVLCEIAIAACDLAEVIGSAIALNLLFGLPLPWGVVLTILDVLVVLYFQNKGFRIIESIVAGLIVVIFGCFLYEIVGSNPDWLGMAARPGAPDQSSDRPRHALHRHRYSGCYRDAAQPVSALQHRANPRHRADRGRQAHGHQVLPPSTRRWRCFWRFS